MTFLINFYLTFFCRLLKYDAFLWTVKVQYFYNVKLWHFCEMSTLDIFLTFIEIRYYYHQNLKFSATYYKFTFLIKIWSQDLSKFNISLTSTNTTVSPSKFKIFLANYRYLFVIFVKIWHFCDSCQHVSVTVASFSNWHRKCKKENLDESAEHW